METSEGRKREVAPAPFGLKIFLGAVILAIVSAVVYGLLLVGSPGEQRLIQFDQRRVSDLQNISFAIDSYYGRTGKLPENLEMLQRDSQYYHVPSIADPKTREAYEYSIQGDVIYELCANFETDSSGYQDGYRAPKLVPIMHPDGRGVEEPWSHGIGRSCFKREIQKALDIQGPPPYSIPVE